MADGQRNLRRARLFSPRLLIIFVGVALSPFRASLQAGLIVQNPQTQQWATVTCYSSTGQIIHNCTVSISNNYYTDSGGHKHNTSRPRSTLFPTSGNTGFNGLPVSITTTAVGQQEWINVCAAGGACTLTDLFVAYHPHYGPTSGWNQNPPYYVFIGGTTIHPDNHYATQNLINKLNAVTLQYYNEFQSDPNFWTLGLNDTSLIFGGVFDVCATSSAMCAEGVRPWLDPHIGHRRANHADFRANGGQFSIINSATVRARFRTICLESGASYAEYHSSGSNFHLHGQWGN